MENRKQHSDWSVDEMVWKNERYIEIDLLRLLKALWRRMGIIISVVILGGGAGFGLAHFVIPPKYKADALLYVNNGSFSVGSTSISLTDLSAAKSLANTYAVILNARLTLHDVIEQAGIDYTYEQLQKKKMITAKAVNGTEMLRITVTSTDPEEAERIANTIVKVLPEKISQIVNGSSVRTVDLAVAPEYQSNSCARRYTLVGALAGLVLSGGIIIVRELLDDQIHDEDFLHQAYGLPVLAAIPDMLSSKSGRIYGSYYAAMTGGTKHEPPTTSLQTTGHQACNAAEQRGIRPSRQSPNACFADTWLVACRNGKRPLSFRGLGLKDRGSKVFSLQDEKKTFGREVGFAASEAYRLLRTNILFALPASGQPDDRPDRQECRVIGITSSLSGEGKSTTALNLAYILSESGQRVLLIDADMRLPAISRRLDLKNPAGLSNLLAGLCQPSSVCQPSGLQERMWVMGAGNIPPNPSELLGAKRMGDMIELLSNAYDFIILDLPPVNEVADALVVSRLAHGMIMVVRKDYATRSSVAEAMRRLSYVKAKVPGFVVTHADVRGGKYKAGKNSQYGYGYHAAENTKKESDG